MMKLLNVAMVQSFDVMLGQTLTHCVEFCNFVRCYIFSELFYLLLSNLRNVSGLYFPEVRVKHA
jgi:hypothetical protein